LAEQCATPAVCPCSDLSHVIHWLRSVLLGKNYRRMTVGHGSAGKVKFFNNYTIHDVNARIKWFFLDFYRLFSIGNAIYKQDRLHC